MISMRPAVPDDRSALEALQFRASIVWEEYRQAIIDNPDAIELPLEQIVDGHTFVAECDGKVVGFGVTMFRADGDAELEALFVEPELWRNAIGRRLVTEAERRATNAGSTLLHVIANPNAEAFYIACGFTFAGEQETRFGTARTMKKSI